MLVSLFVALVFKSPNSDEDADLEEDEEDCELKQDEEWLHSFFGMDSSSELLYRKTTLF